MLGMWTEVSIMIEPYSRRIKGPCKIKRYHELIFKMWYDYKHNGEIAQALIEKAVIQTVGLLVSILTVA